MVTVMHSVLSCFLLLILRCVIGEKTEPNYTTLFHVEVVGFRSFQGRGGGAKLGELGEETRVGGKLTFLGRGEDMVLCLCSCKRVV